MVNFDWVKALQNANGGPLPLVNDQLPWQSYMATQQPMGGLGGTAQDTGPGQRLGATLPGSDGNPWMYNKDAPTDMNRGGGQVPVTPGESVQGPWSDNTPKLGGGKTWTPPPLGSPENPYHTTTRPAASAGAFGTTYTDPGGGWNPWSLYDGREGFDGSAVDGHYNAQADVGTSWGAGEAPVRDRDRVWRWTLDALGPNPGGQPPERVKQVFLEQVARLKRDYLAPENVARGLNWANSAFSGYDKFAQGGAAATSGPAGGRGDQPVTAPGAGAATAAYNAAIAAGKTQQEAAKAAAAAQQAADAAADKAAAAARGGAPPGTVVPPVTSSTSTTTPGTGDTGDYATLMSSDKAFRTAQLLKALGLDDINKRMSYGGSVQADQAPGLYEAWRQTQGLDAGGGTPAATDWGKQIGDFAKTYHGQGAMSNFQQAGQNALQTIMTPGFQQGMTDQELMNLIQGFESLVNAPINDVQKRFRNNLTDQSVGQFLQQPGVETGQQRFIPYLQGNPLYNFLTGTR